MSDIRAEIEIDPQHGPIIRVIVNERTVSVYLMHETGTVLEPSGGQYGIEVKGPWWQFRQIYETEGRKQTAAPSPEWVKTSDRLPTREDADEHGKVWAFAAESEERDVFMWSFRGVGEPITHWMPKPRATPPKPPEGE